MMYKYRFRKKLRIRNKTKKSMLETPTYFLSLFKVWLPFLYGRGGNFFKIPQSLYLSMFYNIFYILKHFFKTLILVLI